MELQRVWDHRAERGHQEEQMVRSHRDTRRNRWSGGRQGLKPQWHNGGEVGIIRLKWLNVKVLDNQIK